MCRGSAGYLGFGNGLSITTEVINFHLELTLLLLQLLLDPLQVVNLLPKLSHAVRVLLPQGGCRGFVLQGGLLQVPAHFLELSLPLLVHLDLGGRGPTSFFQALADLLQFPGEVRALLLSLGPGGPLSLDLLLQLLDAGLKE